jgi:organic radical activating enzyme
MKKVFPIQSKTACLLKWAWSTIFISTQKTSSCHRVNHDDITVENFDSFHNTPQKILAREQMRRGEWPKAGCQYCEKVEDAGGMSYRQVHLAGMHFDVPPELIDNPEANIVTPTIVEVYFSNVCNMGCLYCGSHFSSLWEAENNKFGRFAKKGIYLKTSDDLIPSDSKNYNDLVDKFFNWLENNYKSIKALHILGGEPFYQSELDRCIDFYNTHPAPELRFCIISNLKVSTIKFQATIDKLLKLKSESKIGEVHITGSLDCWGKEAEYIRHGLDLNEYSANIEYLLDKEIGVGINSAINLLSIKTMPGLIEKINYWNSIRVKYDTNPQSLIYWTFTTVVSPDIMCPDIFPEDFFKDDFEKIIAMMPTDSEFQNQQKEHMIGISKQIASLPKNHNKINTLKMYLNEMDRRRNKNWQELFPWLIEQ